MKHIATAFLLLATGITPLAASEPIPALPAQTLSGKQLSLPAGLPNNTVLLIIGFSRASRQQSSTWFQHMQQHFSKGAPTLSLYQLHVLDVPGFLQGFVIGKIHDSVAAQQLPYHLVAVEKIEQWKKLTHFKQSERAYLMLLDAEHRIIWQGSSPFSDASFKELLRQLRKR